MAIGIEDAIVEIQKDWPGFGIERKEIKLADVGIERFSRVLSDSLMSRKFKPEEDTFILDVNCAGVNLKAEQLRDCLSCLYQNRLKLQANGGAYYYTLVGIGDNLANLKEAITKGKSGTVPQYVAASLIEGGGYQLVGWQSLVDLCSPLFMELNKVAAWVLGPKFALATAREDVKPGSFGSLLKTSAALKKIPPNAGAATLYHSITS